MKETTNKKRLVCTVNRKKWVRGGKNGVSRLLNEGGYMCCLGFLGVACGVPKESLRGRLIPSSLSYEEQGKFPTVKSWAAFVDTNDLLSCSEDAREASLKELAKDAGFSFRFVG